MSELRIIACEVGKLRPGDRLRLSAYHQIPEYWARVTRIENPGIGPCLVTVEGIDYPLAIKGIVHCTWGHWKMNDRDDSNVRSAT